MPCSEAPGARLRKPPLSKPSLPCFAALQAKAMRLSTVTYLTCEEAAAAAACNAGQIDRSWEVWRMRAARRRLQPQT